MLPAFGSAVEQNYTSPVRANFPINMMFGAVLTRYAMNPLFSMSLATCRASGPTKRGFLRAKRTGNFETGICSPEHHNGCRFGTSFQTPKMNNKFNHALHLELPQRHMKRDPVQVSTFRHSLSITANRPTLPSVHSELHL